MRLLRLFLFSSLCLSLPNFFTGGFKIPPTQARVLFNPKWDVLPPSDQILTILDQPFSYFSHGNQSTVFESEDGQYVLKLFRYRRSVFPIIHNVKNFFKKKRKQSFQTKIHKTFNATHLAFQEANQFTHVVYAHINLSVGKLPTATLKVKNKTYRIPLDRHRFALQRKASPFKTTLLSAKKNPQEMQALLNSFVTLLIERSALNIHNSDPSLGPNFGFIDGKAVEIDFGNYQKFEATPEEKRSEILDFLARLEVWLQKNAPEYLDYMFDLHRKIAISYDPAT
jgi:hypothetical protein